MSTTTQTTQLKHRTTIRYEDEVYFNDPLSLKPQKTSDEYIHVSLKGQKKLQTFYLNQNDMIDTMLTALNKGNPEEEQKQLLKVNIYIKHK